MPLTLAISLQHFKRLDLHFHMLIRITVTDKNLKLTKASSVQGYGGDNNMKETCEEPCFAKGFIFMEAGI